MISQTFSNTGAAKSDFESRTIFRNDVKGKQFENKGSRPEKVHCTNQS